MARIWAPVLVAASLILATACDAPNGQASQPSPSLVTTSPQPISAWATFALGADKPRQTLANGLQITDIDAGSPSHARAGDLLGGEYIVWLSDGRRIDSSEDHAGRFEFTLGRGEVIAGWDQGVLGMGVGGIRRLVIPPALAYGAKGVADNSGAYAIPPTRHWSPSFTSGR